MAIEPESTTERKKLADVLEMMKRQDPTFHARENEETGQTLISGMGELHLEVIKHRLLRDYRLERAGAQAAGELPRDDRPGGRGDRPMPPQHRRADAPGEARPSAWSRSPQVPSRSSRLAPSETPLPEAFLAAAMEVLAEHAEGGGALGFPLMHLKVTVLGGQTHETESNELAFRFAAGRRLQRGPPRRRASCSWSRSCGWK